MRGASSAPDCWASPLSSPPSAHLHGRRRLRAVQPVKVSVRRITETQYRHTIADMFGPDIVINARFEPEKREDGLLALGSAQLSLTSSGFEQYFALASAISDQAFDRQAPRRRPSAASRPMRRRRTRPAPRSSSPRIGERLFRRPLTRRRDRRRASRPPATARPHRRTISTRA